MKTLAILASLLACLSASAQTTNIADIPNSPAVKAAFISFEQEVISNKSITVALYPTYANGIKVDGKNSNWGGGMALITPATIIPGTENITLAQHAFAGLRLDYIGKQFFASTLTIGLKGDMQLFGHTFTGIVESGANIPLTGSEKDGVVGGMAGVGAYTTLFTFGAKDSSGVRRGAVRAFFVGEKWFQFSGVELHPGIAGTYNF